MTDAAFLKMALERARTSMEQGNFPAGGVIALGGEVLSTAISSPYPGLLHADSKAVSAAFEAHGPLSGATLYVAMESCLMCSGVAYWGGIRRIVYAIPKSRLSPLYYETGCDTKAVIDGFHEPIERVHMPEFEAEALEIVRAWEKANPV